MVVFAVKQKKQRGKNERGKQKREERVYFQPIGKT